MMPFILKYLIFLLPVEITMMSFLILGGLVSHQSPLFQEEFPSLAQEEKNKEQTQTTKKDEDNKDTQYGPGPSLRPQSK